MSSKELDQKKSIIACIRKDWAANGRDWFSLGFRALAVHRIGEFALGLDNKLLRLPLWRVYWFLQRHCRNRGIEIPPQVKIGQNVKISHQGAIVFHPSAVIGDGCHIRHSVTLGAASTRRSADAPTLHDNVDLGAGVAILGGVVIGEGSRIGANVVLTESVPADSVVVVARPQILVKQPGTSRRVAIY